MSNPEPNKELLKALDDIEKISKNMNPSRSSVDYVREAREGGMYGEDVLNQPFYTLNSELPRPSERTSALLMNLLEHAEIEHGLKNGKTAAYWDLVNTLQQHLIK
jgi:hypothetical protein